MYLISSLLAKIGSQSGRCKYVCPSSLPTLFASNLARLAVLNSTVRCTVPATVQTTLTGPKGVFQPSKKKEASLKKLLNSHRMQKRIFQGASQIPPTDQTDRDIKSTSGVGTTEQILPDIPRILSVSLSLSVFFLAVSVLLRLSGKCELRQ